jgi:hypothetical protein
VGPMTKFLLLSVSGLLMSGTLSGERAGLSFTIAVGPRQHILGSESHGTHDHILLSQIGDSPNLEGEVHVFISPRNRAAQLYPKALGWNRSFKSI